MKKSRGEKVFSVFNYLILTSLGIVTLYPFVYVILASFSSPSKLLEIEGLLWKPGGFTVTAYKTVLRNSNLFSGYANTIFYVVAGTLMNIIATVMAGYVLSRKNVMFRRPITLMFIFTMYFSGGMIPSYLLMSDLHLINNRLAVLLPGLVSTYNLLIMINALDAVPVSLEESARIDGASHWKVLWHIILPLAKPTIMVIMMYYAVAHWNSWYNAMLYIHDEKKMPLQLYLRRILIQARMGEMSGDGAFVDDVGMTIQYATIIVSTLPILIIYPLIQKHFVSGVMIGAVKE